MKYLEGGSIVVAKQGGQKAEAAEAITRRWAISDEGEQWVTTMMIWIVDWTDLRRQSGLDWSDLRLLTWGLSGVALALRDWGVAVFRFALGNFLFFDKALCDFWFSDLLCIGFFFFLIIFFFYYFIIFWRICGYLYNLLGLSWAWLN